MNGLTGRIRRHPITIGLAAAGALLLVITMSLTNPAPGSGAPDDTAAAQRLRQIEQTRMQALVDRDMDVVEALHAHDFELVAPPGLLLTRAEYLQDVESGTLDYLVFEPVTKIKVRRYGHAAMLTYRSHIDIIGGGVRLEHEAWHTLLYERRHGHWQAAWEQATAVGGFPPPGSRPAE